MRIRKLEILFEDTHIIVCRKPAGVATQSARAGQQDMVSLIKNQRARQKEEPYVGLIHRLDQPVEGVMVFAKDKQAAAKLSKQVSERGMDKFYLAVAKGKFEQEAGTLEHFLVKDGRTNLSRVAKKDEPEAKRASLSYQVMEYNEEKDASLVKIKLDTGRHHQIRVQMAAVGHPLLGDLKYGAGVVKSQMEKRGLFVSEKAIEVPAGDKNISDVENVSGRGTVALCSHKIGFFHPVTGTVMEYEILPKNPYFDGFESLWTLDN